MPSFFNIRGRAVALALSVTLGAPVSAVWAAPVARDPASAPRSVELTERDVAASNAKVRAAYADLVAMWSGGFTRMNERFAAPHLLRYRGAVRSACGVMQPSN